MSRRRQAIKRSVIADAKYNSVLVGRLVNTVMLSGQKNVARRIVYGAIEALAEKTPGVDPLEIVQRAIDNVKPPLEVRSRRVGGATYQVPVEVKPARRQSLASRWLIDAARGRGEHSMAERLASEFIEASNARGGAMKKREDVHKMAEANKAFAHYRW